MRGRRHRPGGVPKSLGARRQIASCADAAGDDPPRQARTSNSPTTSRFSRRAGASSGASIPPRTPTTAPSSTTSSSTRCRNLRVTKPAASPARTFAAKGATTPGPVPHVMWNRGTELPCPTAMPWPRSAQPTTGKNRRPFSRSHARFSPAANSRYASAHRRPHVSSSRSKPALPDQSSRASSSESCTPSRRCSGVSTRNSPPNDHHACPPRFASGSCRGWRRACRRPPVRPRRRGRRGPHRR